MPKYGLLIRNYAKPKRIRRGLSLLELLVTLAIVALISVAALQLFNNTADGTRRLQQDMVREDAIEHCLDLLVEDLASAAANNIQVRIKNTVLDYDRETAHLTIIAESGARLEIPSRLVEWVAMPRDEFDDLVLYRRVYPSPDRRSTKYIPMCEGLYSFIVEELTDTLLQVTAWVYRDNENDPRRLFPVSRKFCVERFKLYSDHR
jgi:prepilin-type N-terminal cleavage/methylation domain-containing protein